MLPFICLLVAIFILYNIFKAKPVKKTTSYPTFEDPMPIGTEAKIFQALESYYLICHSTTIKVVEEKLAFFDKIMWDLILVYKHSRYPALVKQAVNKYRQDYYDRVLEQSHIDIMLNPKAFLDNLNNPSDLLFRGFLRYAKEEEKQIEALKTKNGKENRTVKLIATAEYYKSHYFVSQDSHLWGKEFIARLNNNLLNYKK